MAASPCWWFLALVVLATSCLLCAPVVAGRVVAAGGLEDGAHQYGRRRSLVEMEQQKLAAQVRDVAVAVNDRNGEKLEGEVCVTNSLKPATLVFFAKFSISDLFSFFFWRC